jgi:hypothetical protein
MQKRQNTHRSIAESIHKIYDHGTPVNAGFIIGFDTEKGSVAGGSSTASRRRHPVNMAGLLFALPTTQLTRRLATAGRLHENFDVAPEGVGDQCTAGLNFDPCRPRLDILKDYLKVVETIYTPENYFGRVLKVGQALDSSQRRFRPGLKQWWKELKGFFRMACKLGLRKETRGQFWSTMVKALWRNPKSIRYTGSLMALYLHFGQFSKYVAEKIREAIVVEESTKWRRPAPGPDARDQAGAGK